MKIDKQAIASKLRNKIAYYTDLTVNEHLNQECTPEADKVWKDITKLINQLAGEA